MAKGARMMAWSLGLARVHRVKVCSVSPAHRATKGMGFHPAAQAPQVKLVAGRWFDPGKREIVVSAKLAPISG